MCVTCCKCIQIPAEIQANCLILRLSRAHPSLFEMHWIVKITSGIQIVWKWRWIDERRETKITQRWELFFSVFLHLFWRTSLTCQFQYLADFETDACWDAVPVMLHDLWVGWQECLHDPGPQYTNKVAYLILRLGTEYLWGPTRL